MPLMETGKVYRVKGKELRLYPIGKLVSELGKSGYYRDAQTIRKWEVAGVIPQTPFRFGGKRLYAMEQIEAICQIAKECDIRQGVAIGKTDFSERVFEELREVNKNLLGE